MTTPLELLALERNKNAILRAEIERIRNAAHAATDDMAGEVVTLRVQLEESLEHLAEARTEADGLRRQVQTLRRFKMATITGVP